MFFIIIKNQVLRSTSEYQNMHHYGDYVGLSKNETKLNNIHIFKSVSVLINICTIYKILFLHQCNRKIISDTPCTSS